MNFYLDSLFKCKYILSDSTSLLMRIKYDKDRLIDPQHALIYLSSRYQLSKNVTSALISNEIPIWHNEYDFNYKDSINTHSEK